MGIAHRDTATKRPNEENIMTSEWYYQNASGRQVGPVTASQLKQMANKGTVEGETLVKKGEGSWVKAIKVRGLFDSQTPDGAKGVPIQPITDYIEAIKLDHFKINMRAIIDYGKAIKLDPKDAKAYYNRGIAYGELKQYDQAITHCTKAIELAKDALAYYSRGIAYLGLQHDKVITDYTKAIELDPKEAKAYNGRGFAYGQLKQYDKAIVDYNKAIELDPKYAGAYANRGIAYFDLQQYDKAIADYTRAIELDPEDSDTYDNRRFAYLEVGKKKEAKADFAKAKMLNEGN